MAVLICVRHGETTWNASGKLQGQLETDLNEAGRKQASALAEHFATELSGEKNGIAAVYSSDLRRAADTARAIADRMGFAQVGLTPMLRERHMGRLQGMSKDQARAREARAFKVLASSTEDEAIPGGGESFGQMRDRASRAAEEIAQRHQGERVIVVTHGGVLQALHVTATGKAARPAANASISVLSISSDKQWKVQSWGNVEHLKSVGFLSSAFGGGADSG